jgi:uncharacterized protein YciW
MSDTPRTDANICDHFWNGKEYVEAVTADFARELERERDEAREQLVAACTFADQLAWTPWYIRRRNIQ